MGSDMTQRWTNDIYVSTPHRAINVRSPAGEEQHRYSLPFFFEPNIDARIEVIPECVSATQPAKYEPIIFAQHLTNMYQKTFSSEQHTQQPTK